MFRNTKYYGGFNKDISKWNTRNVKYMEEMFLNSKFNQDISQWYINSKCNTENMFKGCPIKQEYEPKKHIKKKTKLTESFNFNSVNKEKKFINIFPKIRELIKTPYKKLT
jgi:surface protein